MVPTNINQPESVDVNTLLREAESFKKSDKGKFYQRTLVVVGKDGDSLQVKKIGPLARIKAGLNQGQASRKAIMNVVAKTNNPESMKKVYDLLGVTTKLDKAVEKAERGNFSGIVKVLKSIDVSTNSDAKVAPIVDKLADALLLAGKKRPNTVDTVFSFGVQKKILQYAVQKCPSNKVTALLTNVPNLKNTSSAKEAFLEAVASGKRDLVEQLPQKWNFLDGACLDQALSIAKHKGNQDMVTLLDGLKVSSVRTEVAKPEVAKPKDTKNIAVFLQAVTAGNLAVVEKHLGDPGEFLDAECLRSALESAVSALGTAEQDREKAQVIRPIDDADVDIETATRAHQSVIEDSDEVKALDSKVKNRSDMVTKLTQLLDKVQDVKKYENRYFKYDVLGPVLNKALQDRRWADIATIIKHSEFGSDMPTGMERVLQNILTVTIKDKQYPHPVVRALAQQVGIMENVVWPILSTAISSGDKDLVDRVIAYKVVVDVLGSKALELAADRQKTQITIALVKRGAVRK